MGHDLPFGRTAEDLERRANGRLRVLRRYHLENYFLDEHVLAAAFETLEPAGSWLRSPEAIRKRLRELAGPMVSYAAALTITHQCRDGVGNIDIMPKDCHGKEPAALASQLAARAQSESVRVATALETARLTDSVSQIIAKLQDSLTRDTDDWKVEIPGKPLLNSLAAVARLDVGRLKNLYLAAADRSKLPCFADVIEIFGSFDSRKA